MKATFFFGVMTTLGVLLLTGANPMFTIIDASMMAIFNGLVVSLGLLGVYLQNIYVSEIKQNVETIHINNAYTC